MIGKILGNRYEIVEKIGGGGMALVFKAKCNLLNRYVAVKILRPEFTSDKALIDKFKRESQAAASLSHPNVVNIYDVGECEEIYYIVMEYVAGKTLKEVIREKGLLSIEEIIDYSRQIAFALRHAHHNHIIHRDIKPHNILVTNDKRAKVTDFGIALAASSSTMTNSGSVFGSVHYFSPEQARGGYTDEKSDLYSLGIVMYEMATGKVPFDGDSPITVALKHIQDKPITPSEINPKLPQVLEDIILKLMMKEQSSRYQNTEELLDDLTKLKNDPHTKTFHQRVSQEDSPTQIIPIISDEDIKKNTNINTTTNTNTNANQPPKKNKKVNKTIVIYGVVAALIAALLFTFGFYYFGSIFRTAEVEVPNFVGMSQEDAEALVETLGLTLSVQTRYDDEVEENHIISQTPSEGTMVKEGYGVRVIVSIGTKDVEVPDIVFRSEADVPYILTNAHLTEGEKLYEFSDLSAGTIIRQNPRAGATVAQGTAVTFVVSKGPEKVTVTIPNMVGTDLEVARRSLGQLKLRVGSIREEFSNEFPINTVISQGIQAGVAVEENTEINLVISKGPEKIDPPVEETPPNEENNDEDTTVNNSVKSITINLEGYTGTVDLEIFRITSSGKQRLFNKKHNVEKEGQYVTFNASGSGRQVFEVYLNGKKDGEQIVINF